MNKPRGNWATLLLPIREDDSIDFDLLAREVAALIAFRVDGIYSNGTAGEFYNQTEQEFRDVQNLFAELCRAAGMPFQIGISHPFPAVALQRARDCRELKPDACQVILPDWFPPKFSECLAFIRRMAEEAAPVPLVLYNPPHAKVRLMPTELLILAEEVPSLVGIKVPGGDENWYREMQPVFEKLSVFVPGHTLATGHARGAHGAYSNVDCLHPGAAQAWWHQIQTDLPRALETERRLQQFMREEIVPLIEKDGFSNQAVDKLMAAASGWTPITSRLRWPYRWISDTIVQRTRERAIAIVPEFISDGK